VVRSIALPTHASLSEVLEKTLAIEQEVEREHEQYLVDTLLSSSGEAGGAVTGIEATLEALNQGRVWELLYADGFSEAGYKCPHCSTLFSEEQTTCSYCGNALQPTNLLEKATEHTLNLSGKVEFVKGKAREQLQQDQGIGAFLRA
jgi:peptide subunit release factor 1 (eRF1)